jgi:hypothetical protein
MKQVTYGLLILLAILHHDFWNWDTYEPLVFGFVPIGLAWHVGISIAAAVLWAMAVRYCWPTDVDELDPAVETGGGPGSGSGHSPGKMARDGNLAPAGKMARDGNLGSAGNLAPAERDGTHAAGDARAREDRA